MSERFLWVCELNKDEPAKIWKATDLTEEEEDDDQDFVLHSLVVKTAVLGAKAVEGERNIIALKTKGYHDKEFEQPIFSLTLGKTDMIPNLDLPITTRDNQTVEFKLVEGSGPVFITCSHVVEVPTPDEGPALIAGSDEEEDEDASDEDMTEDAEAAGKGKGKAKNGKAAASSAEKDEVDIDDEEKPKKRKRN